MGNYTCHTKKPQEKNRSDRQHKQNSGYSKDWFGMVDIFHAFGAFHKLSLFRNISVIHL